MQDQFLKHAEAEYPRECCGLVVSIGGVEQYFPCKNIAGDMGHFAIDPVDYAKAEDAGEVVAVVHSHPDGPLKPSTADVVGCNKSGLPWHIVDWPRGDMLTISPSSFELPLLGREFCHGVIDCYTAIRDLYGLAGIELADYDRTDDWWDKGEDLYENHVQQEGFEQLDSVRDLEPGDLIFMQIRSSVVNHSAVYLGNNLIYHHLPNRLSERAVYGGFFQKCSRSYWRHSQWQKSPFTDSLLSNLEKPLS